MVISQDSSKSVILGDSLIYLVMINGTIVCLIVTLHHVVAVIKVCFRKDKSSKVQKIHIVPSKTSKRLRFDVTTTPMDDKETQRQSNKGSPTNNNTTGVEGKLKLHKRLITIFIFRDFQKTSIL